MNQPHKDKKKYTYYDHKDVLTTLMIIAKDEASTRGRTVTVPELIRNLTSARTNTYLRKRGQREIKYDTSDGGFGPTSVKSIRAQMKTKTPTSIIESARKNNDATKGAHQMAWTKITRDDLFEGSDAPFITITEAHFRFNSRFVAQASLDPSYRVTIFTDEQNRRFAFEFHKDQRPCSFTLTARSDSSDNSHKLGGLVCSSRGIVSEERPWLASVANRKNSGKNRRFFPKKEGNKWVIQLCPAFEIRKARESEDFCSTDVGIYRYLRANDEIVYIGRGPITARLRSPERKMWDFHVIEYSIVPDPDDQVKWEDYWIERYKADHHGKKPFYNRVSGSGKHREAKA